MRLITYSVLSLIVLLGVTFACLNADPVKINYYIGSDTLPLSLLLVIALCMGTLLGLIVSMPVLFKMKRDTLRLRHRIKVSEKEINNLRSIPLKDHH